jgi:hypothetical protein
MQIEQEETIGIDEQKIFDDSPDDLDFEFQYK